MSRERAQDPWCICYETFEFSALDGMIREWKQEPSLQGKYKV